MQSETISLIKFQPSHGSVDFLGILGAFCWENPNPDSCFYFKAANSLLTQKRPTSCKIKKTRKNLLEEKLVDLAPLSSCMFVLIFYRMLTAPGLEEFVSLTSFEENLLH